MDFDFDAEAALELMLVQHEGGERGPPSISSTAVAMTMMFSISSTDEPQAHDVLLKLESWTTSEKMRVAEKN